MLKKVHISNFLSCQDTEIELDEVTALIGRNAAGKTNILKAIEGNAQFAVGTDYFESDELQKEYGIEFLLDDNIFKYEIKITVEHKFIYLIEILSCYINSNWQLIAERKDDSATHYKEKETIYLEINTEAPMISSLLSLLPKKKLNPSIVKVFNYFSGIKYYTLDDDKYKNRDSNGFSNLISANNYKQWLSKNKAKTSVEMRLLHLWHEDKKLLEELQELLGKNGLNVVKDIEIIKFDYRSRDEDNFYTVKFHIANVAVSYGQLSYGTQRVLTLLLALLYDKNSTLLIEQPEDGIHSGLLKKLLPLCFEYSKTYNKQLIIATHSPEVINLLPPESIRLVRMSENGTKVSPLNKEQVPLILDYIENEGTLFDFIESMDDE